MTDISKAIATITSIATLIFLCLDHLPTTEPATEQHIHPTIEKETLQRSIELMEWHYQRVPYDRWKERDKILYKSWKRKLNGTVAA